MVREKFAVWLTPEERDQLEHMVRAGRSSARVTARARILLKTAEGWSAPKVAQALVVSEGTVFRQGYGPGPHPAQDRRGLVSSQGSPGPGCVRGHGVPPQAAFCRGWVGRGTE